MENAVTSFFFGFYIFFFANAQQEGPGQGFALADVGHWCYTVGMDLSAFREEYLKDTLHRENLADTPQEQFDRWFKQALESGIPEPNAMSIATATPQGMPSLRTVLLKYYDEKGYVFFTNYTSRKAREIALNPEMCMLLPWVTLERQIIVYGRAEKISCAETLKYFLTRPRESQLGAWVSHQSQVISTRKLLMMKLQELKKKFSEGEVPLPDFWGGFRIVPRQMEFWQGGPGRVHDRFMYTLQPDGSWNIERLQP